MGIFTLPENVILTPTINTESKKDEKIIRIVPISPTEIKTKSIINKEDIETKYGIVTYNPNKPNKKGND